MARVNQDFELFQGVDCQIDIEVEDANSNPLDMTGFGTPSWRLTSLSDKDTVILSKTPTVVNLQAVNDGLRFTLVPADCALLLGEYYHEARITDAGGLTAVVLTGVISILESSTG